MTIDLRPRLLLTVLAAMLPSVLPGPADAQELERGETVLQRRRPEVEALGVRAGSFLVLPRLEVGATYDSNVFATDTDKKDDLVWIVNPELAIRSDFSNHALNFRAAGALARHHEYESENFSDFVVESDGRLDVTRDIALDARVFHRQEHEGRGDPDTFAGYAEPVIYTRSGGSVGYQQRFNRLRARLDGTAEYQSYDSVRLLNGGESAQNDRDRWLFGTSLRVGYEFLPGYEGFVRGTLNRTVYQVTPDDSGVNRSSHGYEVVAGTAVELTGLITGEIFAGWLSRSYEDPALKDFGGLGFGGRLNWAVTQLTTITGSLSREVRESTFVQNGQRASSYDRSIIALGVDHELLRTLLLNGRLQYRQDDFQGVKRTDDVYTVGIGATYLINRNLYLSGGVTYENRESDTPGNAYDSSLVFLRLGVQL